MISWKCELGRHLECPDYLVDLCDCVCHDLAPDEPLGDEEEDE